MLLILLKLRELFLLFYGKSTERINLQDTPHLLQNNTSTYVEKKITVRNNNIADKIDLNKKNGLPIFLKRI